MAEIFLSIDEAACLEGISYEGMKKNLQRNSKNFITKLEKNPEGGRDRVLVALSSLSHKARKTHKKNNQVGGEIMVATNPETTIPWYVDVDLSWYITKYDDTYYKALDIAQDIKAFLEYNEADRTSFADEFAAEMGVSQRTLYRYAESYLEAESWALHMFKQNGKTYEHYKALSMCRKPRESNTFPSLTEEHRALIENIWFHKGFAQNHGTVEMLYTQFQRTFEERGMEYPSYKTVARYVRHLMEDKRMKNARTLAESGEREYKRNVMMKGRRDTSAVPVLGIVQGDSHTLDFWVQYTDPDNGKISAIRPTMVAWIDTRTRVVMGCVWAKNVNTQVVKQSMVKLVYEYGVPACILIDNGKDYTSNEMLGRNRKERNKLLALDKEATGFYRSLGIRDDYRALPYQPWSKGPIERLFGTVCEQFSKWFSSYTGTLTGAKTSGKIKKDVDKLLAQGKLLTMEEAFTHWDMWLQGTYHQKRHEGLKKMGEQWTTPIQLFENATNRIEIAAPPKELAEMLLMKVKEAKVLPIGIKLNNQVYMDYALNTYIHERVRIRWNPSDMARIYVYDLNNRRICEARCQELLQYQGLITERQLIDHVKQQKRQLAEDKLRLEAATTPYELRGHNGDRAITGTFDLMIEKKQTQAIECEAKLIEEKTSASITTDNSYFEDKAREVLKKMRELG